MPQAVCSDEANPPRWRFGLPGLMVLILGVALGLGEYKSRVRELPAAAPAALRAAHMTLSCWLLLGLAAQAWRLWRLGGELADAQRRFANTLGIAFRLGLVLLIVAFHARTHLHAVDASASLAGQRFAKPSAAEDYYRVMYSGALVLVACLARHTRGFWEKVSSPELLLIAWTLAIPAAAMALIDRLTETARAQAVVAAAPYGGKTWLALHIWLFVPAAMAAVYLLASRNPGPRRRSLYLGVLLATAGLQVLSLLQLRGLLGEIARMALAGGDLREFLLAGTLCVILLATLVAYGMVRRRAIAPTDVQQRGGEASAAHSPPALNEANRFWHEHRLVWLLLGGVLWLEFCYGWQSYAALRRYPAWSPAMLSYLVAAESVVPHLLAAAVACMAGLAHAQEVSARDAPAVPPRRFWWVWLAVNAISLLAIGSVAVLVLVANVATRS